MDSNLPSMQVAQDPSAFGLAGSSMDLANAMSMIQPPQSIGGTGVMMPPAQEISSFGTVSPGSMAGDSVQAMMGLQQPSASGSTAPPMPQSEDLSTFGFATQLTAMSSTMGSFGGMALESDTPFTYYGVVGQMPRMSPSTFLASAARNEYPGC